MRVLDGEERSDYPWEGDETKREGDRASCSLVNRRHPDVYECLTCPVGKKRMPGFVIASSSAAQERIVCSYYKDGGTLAKQCDHSDPSCRPGCANLWCENGRLWNCDYQPHRLKDMMDRQDKEMPQGHIKEWGYNEVRIAARAASPRVPMRALSKPPCDVLAQVILDTWRRPWASDLPGLIEAVFVQAGSTAAEQQYGREVHRKFLDHFGVSASDVPLLEYDATDARAPFRAMRS
eukprot:scaffold241393_cov32-Tisochrysis_lutea.AAC.2